METKNINRIIKTLYCIEFAITSDTTIINDKTAYVLNEHKINSVKEKIKEAKERLSVVNSDYADDNMFEYIDRTIDAIEQLIFKNNFGNVCIVDTTALNRITEEMENITEKLTSLVENASNE